MKAIFALRRTATRKKPMMANNQKKAITASGASSHPETVFSKRLLAMPEALLCSVRLSAMPTTKQTTPTSVVITAARQNLVFHAARGCSGLCRIVGIAFCGSCRSSLLSWFSVRSAGRGSVASMAGGWWSVRSERPHAPQKKPRSRHISAIRAERHSSLNSFRLRRLLSISFFNAPSSASM